ncbi:hypothetical protein C8Q78DRAFT_654635 [Trametes maxima]|nr:hypothetical protein C8Q78DRAFT_654635 [Trametes maxima]
MFCLLTGRSIPDPRLATAAPPLLHFAATKPELSLTSFSTLHSCPFTASSHLSDASLRASLAFSHLPSPYPPVYACTPVLKSFTSGILHYQTSPPWRLLSRGLGFVMLLYPGGRRHACLRPTPSACDPCSAVSPRPNERKRLEPRCRSSCLRTLDRPKKRAHDGALLPLSPVGTCAGDRARPVHIPGYLASTKGPLALLAGRGPPPTKRSQSLSHPPSAPPHSRTHPATCTAGREPPPPPSPRDDDVSVDEPAP